MRIQFLVIFCVYLFLPDVLHAQDAHALRQQFDQAADPVEKAKLGLMLGDYYFYKIQDSATYYFNAAKNAIPPKGNDSLYIRIYDRSSVLNEMLGNIPQSLEDIRKAYTRVNLSGRESERDQMYTLIGRYHMRALNYDSATYYWNLLIDSKTKKGDDYAKWLPYHYLGLMYSDLGEWPKAKNYFLQSLEYARLEKKPKDFPYLLYMILQQCDLWNEQDLYSDLKDEYLQFKQSRGQNILTPEHSLLRDPESTPAARRHKLLKYLPYHLKNDNNLSTCETYFQLGETYMEEKNYPEAIKYFSKMLPFSDSIEVATITYNIHDALYRAYRENHDLNHALEHHEVMLVMRDSILNLEKQNQMNDIQVKYETSQKEKQLAETTLHLETAKKKQQFLGFGLIGALLVAGSTYYALRIKKKSNTQLEEKNKQINQALKEKDILLREIHHRVKNNLQMISALLYLHGKSLDDSSAQVALMESQNRVQSMAMIHQNLYQNENLLGVSVQEYLDKLIHHLIDSYNIEKDRIEIRKNIEIKHLDVDTIIPLALIINELISNSLKYAFQDGRKGVIEIFLGQANDQIKLEVRDNGIGITPSGSNKPTGNFGFKLINILSERLGATWETRSHDGTIVTLIFPQAKAA